MFSTLYAMRPLLNAEEVIAWYQAQGFDATFLPSEKLHVTIAYSRRPLDWPVMDARPVLRVQGGGRRFGLFGEDETSLALVQQFWSSDLTDRWSALMEQGASWDFPEYRPHVTLAYGPRPRYDINSVVKQYMGDLVFGPEQFAPIDEEWKDNLMDSLDKAIVAEIPVLIKALPVGADGRRLVEVEASCEDVDYDGDVILQSALLASAEHFKSIGTLDIDHLSEIGDRLNPPIPDPASYIVGRPLEVKALPGNRTSVIGEIRKSRDGTVNPAVNRYDELWLSFQSEPAVRWYSSVFGYLRNFDDCRTGVCGKSGAKRFLVKEFEWKSLAFTRSPKNTGLKGEARILTAKSFIGDYHAAKILSTASSNMQAAGIVLVGREGSTPRILMLKRSAKGDHAGEWAFPGGKLEGSESTEAAAKRELYEETGFELSRKTKFLTRRVADGVDFTTYVSSVPVMFTPHLDDEHTDWAWVSLDDLPKPRHPGCEMTLEALREQPLAKDMLGSDPFAGPSSMQDLVGTGKCAGCGVGDYPSLLGYRQHFEKCMSLPPGASDIYAHAMMHRYNMDKSFSGAGGPAGNLLNQ